MTHEHQGHMTKSNTVSKEMPMLIEHSQDYIILNDEAIKIICCPCVSILPGSLYSMLSVSDAQITSFYPIPSQPTCNEDSTVLLNLTGNLQRWETLGKKG